MPIPDYSGGSLVNLLAELEHRLAGDSPSPPLHPDLAALIPEAPTYLLFLLDGLGDHQLTHQAARSLQAARQAVLDAPFPTTTSVSLASVATGLPPVAHGLLGYQLWLPEADVVANTLRWTTLWGDPLDVVCETFLPKPNLWERLSVAGVEPVTVQPGGFLGSPLSRVLYDGARFEPAYTTQEFVDACLDLAAPPGRLVFAYLPHVDVAAHTTGQDSPEYDEAMHLVAGVWDSVVARLPEDTVAIGVSDHGHVDVPPLRRADVPTDLDRRLTLYGDSRVMFVRGDPALGRDLAEVVGARWVPVEEMRHWWGDGPAHHAFAERAPVGSVIAPPGHLVLHRFSDTRLIGAHGGLTEEEVRIPLLIAGR